MNSQPAHRAESNVRVAQTSVDELRSVQEQAEAAGGGETLAKKNDDGSSTLYVDAARQVHPPSTFGPDYGSAVRSEKQHLRKQLIDEIIRRRLSAEAAPGQTAPLLRRIDEQHGNSDLAGKLATETTAVFAPSRTPAAGDPPSPLVDPEAALAYFVERRQGWNEIKRAYIPADVNSGSAQDVNTKKREINAMKQLRQRIVDGLLDAVINRLHEDVKFTSAGSDNPTSDYDVQLYDSGSLQGNPGRVIAEFNRIFRERYGLESGTLLDTNLYDPSFRLPREDATENAAITASEARVEEANSNPQLVGSFAKIRKFASEDVWAALEKGISTGIPTDSRKAAAENLLDQAVKKIDAMNQKIAAAERSPDRATTTDDDHLRATNLLYTQALEQVQQARKLQEACVNSPRQLEAREAQESALDAATLMRKEAMVDATLFAHEAYHSEGPMIDVVGISQKSFEKSFTYKPQELPATAEGSAPRRVWGERIARGNPTLTPTQLLESFNENFGDALKDIAHYNQGDGAYDRTMVQTAKYCERLFGVAERLEVGLTPRLSAVHKHVARLKELRAGGIHELGEVGTALRDQGMTTIDDLIHELTQLAIVANVKVLAPEPAKPAAPQP